MGEAHQENLVGGSMPATVAYMLRISGGGATPAEVEAWMLEGMIARLAGGVEMMPGAAELLAEVRGAAWPPPWSPRRSGRSPRRA